MAPPARTARHGDLRAARHQSLRRQTWHVRCRHHPTAARSGCDGSSRRARRGLDARSRSKRSLHQPHAAPAATLSARKGQRCPIARLAWGSRCGRRGLRRQVTTVWLSVCCRPPKPPTRDRRGHGAAHLAARWSAGAAGGLWAAASRGCSRWPCELPRVGAPATMRARSARKRTSKSSHLRKSARKSRWSWQ